MTQEQVIAPEAISVSQLVDPQKSANTKAMFATAIELQSSSEGMDEAKEALNTSISKMMAEPDPFMQMMIAIYEVIPGTLLYKEEKLMYDTDTFEFVTQMNNHLTKAMDFYSKSGDYVATSGAGTPDERGMATSGLSINFDIWGMAAGDAYLQEMADLKALVNSSGLPPEIIESMNRAFEKISVASSSSLWNGLQNAYRYSGESQTHTCKVEGSDTCGSWKQIQANHDIDSGTHKYDWICRETGVQKCAVAKRDCYAIFWAHVGWKDDYYLTQYNCTGHTLTGGTAPGEYVTTVGDDDWFIRYNGSLTEEGYSRSSQRLSATQGAVDSSTTGNLELQTTINSYSASVEAEFMFDMEQYNTYANTNSQVMNGHIDQVGASSSRLTNLSHA